MTSGACVALGADAEQQCSMEPGHMLYRHGCPSRYTVLILVGRSCIHCYVCWPLLVLSTDSPSCSAHCDMMAQPPFNNNHYTCVGAA
jgi:hypothetical protein